MKTAISTFVTIILITLASLISTTYIASHLAVVKARDYHASVVDRIEASYFSHNVMSEVVTEAAERGYELTIRDVTIYEDKKDVLVSLAYSVDMPIFGVIKEGLIEGYTR